MIRERKERIKAVFEDKSVLGMFVKNQTGDLDIADFGIKNGGFTQDVNTLDLGNVFENFFENMIGGEAERIVDIEN